MDRFEAAMKELADKNTEVSKALGLHHSIAPGYARNFEECPYCHAFRDDPEEVDADVLRVYTCGAQLVVGMGIERSTDCLSNELLDVHQRVRALEAMVDALKEQARG